MRPFGSAKNLEARRRRAIKLLEEGLSLREIARRVGCNASSVMRWRDAVLKGGENALKPKPTPGRPSKLTDKQKKRLADELLKGPLSNGYRTDIWTTQRIADLIEKMFAVKYHRDHIGRLMRSLGWSCQKPDRRGTPPRTGIRRKDAGRLLGIRRRKREVQNAHEIFSE